MPNDLIATDPIIAQNFFLEIDGNVVTILASVSGLDVEMEVATTQQVGKDGKSMTVKTLAGRNKAPDLSLVRMAPPDSTQDKMWGWFNDIMTKGILLSDRTNNRKNGSIVMYDSTHVEVARFNFTNGWPSKISTDQLSVDSNDPVKETITLTIESLAPIQKRCRELLDSGELDDLLKAGAARAGAVAGETLRHAKYALGLLS